MAASDFLNRWSKTKPTDASLSVTPEPAATLDASPPAKPASVTKPTPSQPLPTMEDVAKLAPNSDYSAFVAKGVDEGVKRLAMKKLFSDPHFNIMDGLDIYIDDYNKFEPIPAEMLARLDHAKSILDPLGHLESSGMRMISRDDVPPPEPDTLQTDAGTGEIPSDAKIEGVDAQPETGSSADATDVDPLEEAGTADGPATAVAEEAAATDTAHNGVDNKSPACREMDPAGLASHDGQPEHQSGAAARPDGKS